MEGGRSRSGGRRSAQGPLRRRRFSVAEPPAEGGGGPGRAEKGRAAAGGSFLEERCHLKEAADRDARAAAGTGPARSPPPPARPGPARPGVPPGEGRGGLAGPRVLEAWAGGFLPCCGPLEPGCSLGRRRGTPETAEHLPAGLERPRRSVLLLLLRSRCLPRSKEGPLGRVLLRV